MRRRAFLGTVGFVGASSLAACQQIDRSTPTATSDRPRGETATPGQPGLLPEYADQYERVVNLRDVGAVPGGQEDIHGLVADHAGDDTLLYLPPGTYRMERGLSFFDFTNFGIVGDRATIRPADGSNGSLFDLGKEGRARDLLVRGIEFDIRMPETGPRLLNVKVGGRVLVRDVSVRGVQDAASGLMRFDVTDPDGVAHVERMSLPHGSTPEAFSHGCYVGNEHRGRIWFRDCTIEGFANNGLYAQPDRGSVRVVGGTYANCGIASLRVGDNSIVRGAHIRCDRAPDGFENMRGLRLREGRDVLVEDCLVELVDLTNSDGALVIAPWLESATIRDTSIRVDVDDVAAVLAKEPRVPVDDETTLRFENVTIEGTASGGAAVRILSRDGTVFDSVRVRQTGVGRDGFSFNDTRGAVIRDSEIDVTDRPVVARDSEVEWSTVAVASPGGSRGLHLP